MVRVLPIGCRHDFHQFFFDVIDGLAGGKPGTVADAEDMGIDGDCRLAKSHIEDDVGRFAPDAGQAHEHFAGLRDAAGIFVNQDARKRQDVFGLGVVKPDGADMALELVDPQFDHVFGGRYFLEEKRCCLVDADIGCLRRQDHRHQQGIGIGIVQLSLWRWVLCGETREKNLSFLGFHRRLVLANPGFFCKESVMSFKIIEHDRRDMADVAPLLRFAVVAIKGAGPMLLAVNDHGLCWLGMTDDIRYLKRNFPQAVLLRDDKLVKLGREISALWSGRSRVLSVPLVLIGTDFERAVWLRLLKIKKGTTVSYSDIARQIGSPRAVRAVGTAVGRNPLTLIVPCHRVLAQARTGQLKFGWGPSAKRKLLAAEGVAV